MASRKPTSTQIFVKEREKTQTTPTKYRNDDGLYNHAKVTTIIMTLTDKAILVVLMVGNTSCYGGECMMMQSQSLQYIAIFLPKKTIFPQHSYRDIMDRQQDDDGDAADADADAPSTDKLNGRNARI